MKHLLFFSVLCCTAACSPKYYAPNTQQVTGFHEKGDVALTAAAGFDNLVDMQTAYAVSDRFAVQLNGGVFTRQKEEGTGDGGNGYLVEGGAGYYKPFADDKLVFESYLLAGFGHMYNNFPSTLAAYPNTTGKIDASLFRIGLQPALTFSTRFIDVAVSSRFALLQYNGIKGSLTFGDVDQVQYLHEEKGQFVAEPALTVRLGLKRYKLQGQIGRSFNLTNDQFPQSNGWISLGFGCRL